MVQTLDTEYWILQGGEGWVADLLRGCIQEDQPTHPRASLPTRKKQKRRALVPHGHYG